MKKILIIIGVVVLLIGGLFVNSQRNYLTDEEIHKLKNIVDNVESKVAGH